jgi:hypothetical protein
LSVAELCTLVGPCGFPRIQRQDASTPFLQPTFRVTSTRNKHHLWRPPAERRGKPADVRLRDRARAAAFPPFRPSTAPDHLAVIRPPTASCLTARRRLRVDRAPTLALSRQVGGRAPSLFRRNGGPVDRDPLTPLRGGQDGSQSGPEPSRVSTLRPGHVNAPIFASSRCLPSKKTNACPLAKARAERCARWPAGADAARLHRCSRTPTRPLSACCSQASSRPRALPRLLQVDVSTSTNADHSNTPITGEGGWGDCRDQTGGCPSIRDNHRKCSGSGVENTEPRRSPLRLLAMRTLPQPRSRRAPLVAGIPQNPCRERRGVWEMPPSPRALARRAWREGRAAPDFREETRRSPTRGAFHRAAARGASWARLCGQRGLSTGRRRRFFHHLMTHAGDARADRRWLGPSSRESGGPLCWRRTAAPLTTSAFEWRSAGFVGPWPVRPPPEELLPSTPP